MRTLQEIKQRVIDSLNSKIQSNRVIAKQEKTLVHKKERIGNENQGILQSIATIRKEMV